MVLKFRKEGTEPDNISCYGSFKKGQNGNISVSLGSYAHFSARNHVVTPEVARNF